MYYYKQLVGCFFRWLHANSYILVLTIWCLMGMTPRYERGAYVALKEHKVFLKDFLSVFFSSANSILQAMKKLPSVLQ